MGDSSFHSFIRASSLKRARLVKPLRPPAPRLARIRCHRHFGISAWSFSSWLVRKQDPALFGEEGPLRGHA